MSPDRYARLIEQALDLTHTTDPEWNQRWRRVVLYLVRRLAAAKS